MDSEKDTWSIVYFNANPIGGMDGLRDILEILRNQPVKENKQRTKRVEVRPPNQGCNLNDASPNKKRRLL